MLETENFVLHKFGLHNLALLIGFTSLRYYFEHSKCVSCRYIYQIKYKNSETEKPN
jgi:hypothetical protein